MPTINLQIPNRLQIDDSFGFWFTGFFDGERSLIIGQQPSGLGYQRIRIGQRSNDQQVLHFIKKNLDVGDVTRSYRTPKGKPVSFYQLTDNKKLAEVIIPLFETYCLRSKKAKEYLIWKAEVLRQYSYFLNGICRKVTTEEIELTKKSIT